MTQSHASSSFNNLVAAGDLRKNTRPALPGLRDSTMDRVQISTL